MVYSALWTNPVFVDGIFSLLEQGVEELKVPAVDLAIARLPPLSGKLALELRKSSQLPALSLFIYYKYILYIAAGSLRYYYSDNGHSHPTKECSKKWCIPVCEWGKLLHEVCFHVKRSRRALGHALLDDV